MVTFSETLGGILKKIGFWVDSVADFSGESFFLNKKL